MIVSCFYRSVIMYKMVSCVANVAFVRSQLQRWTKNCSILLLYIIREGRNPGNINLSILIRAFISTTWI